MGKDPLKTTSTFTRSLTHSQMIFSENIGQLLLPTIELCQFSAVYSRYAMSLLRLCERASRKKNILFTMYARSLFLELATRFEQLLLPLPERLKHECDGEAQRAILRYAIRQLHRLRQEFFIQLRSLEGICGQIPLKLEPVEHPCHQSMDNAIAQVELTFKSFVMGGDVFPAVNRITAARTGAELAYREILERLGETEADIRVQVDEAFRTFAKEHNQALAGIAGKARGGQVWPQFFLAGIVIERACVALIDDLILLVAEM